MTLIFITGFVLGAIAVIVFAVRSSMTRATFQPFDVAAFRTLTDREEERFLRERLSLRAFFHIKRQRIRVTGQYLGRIAANAAVILQINAAARMTHDSEIIRSMSQMADLATQVRLQCLLAFSKLCVEFMLPSLELRPTLLTAKYEALWENVARLNPISEGAVALASTT